MSGASEISCSPKRRVSPIDLSIDEEVSDVCFACGAWLDDFALPQRPAMIMPALLHHSLALETVICVRKFA